MLEARQQFISMVKSAFPMVVVILSLSVLIEVLWIGQWPIFFLGAACGCAYALMNLWVLFSMFAPYFFQQERPLHILYGAVISLGVGVLLVFVANMVGQSFAIGMALGIASPAAIGVLHSFQSISAMSKN